MRIHVHDTIKLYKWHRRALIPYLHTVFGSKETVIKVYRICVSGRITFCALLSAICVMKKVVKYNEMKIVELKGKSVDGKEGTDGAQYDSMRDKRTSNGCRMKVHELNGPLKKLSTSLKDDYLLFAASLIITTKVLFDYVYATTDWSKLTKLTVKQLNEVERYVLFLLDYKVVLENGDVEVAMRIFEKKGECKVVFGKKSGLRGVVEWMVNLFGCENG
ncbi:putative Cyclin-related 2 protein [Trachipleistophora hominis]|uniref:Putative Cyclin-related 2 protein n=1 Tax=Trachipleistophora hominis TaxID=72359 RepID=L7JXL3_TRAHO|nr:putative Cyclin-related 2 protein [Trachipleistophora hominis]